MRVGALQGSRLRSRWPNIDVGAKNDAYGLYEKNLTLDVASRLHAMLQHDGYEVIMTRDSDVYIPLERRPQIANRENGDLFISIHFNAAGSSTAEGFETFALTAQKLRSAVFRQTLAQSLYDGIALYGKRLQRIP